MSAFASWSEALPFALRLARKFARSCPLGIDAESVAMEAIWKAQCAGATFSKSYVIMRVRGALQDEMRKLGHGSRSSGYMDAGAFTDVSEAYWLADDGVCTEQQVDRAALIERMAPAGQYLVREIVKGKQLEEIGSELGVSGARVCQVVAQLKSRPGSVTKLPGTIDLYSELRATRDRSVRNAMNAAPSLRQAAAAVGAEAGSFLNWASARGGMVNLRANQPSLVRDQMRARADALVRAAFAKAGGSPSLAARYLNVSVMTAWRWGRFVGVATDNRKRREVTEIECARLRAKGLSHQQIATQLGCPREMVTRRLAAIRRLAKCEGGV
jgi:hypothetical protein